MERAIMAVFAALILATHVSSLTPYVLLPSLPYSCSTSDPLLSSDRFALLCIQAHTRNDFFLAVSFFNPPGPPVWIANPSRPVSRNASLVLLDTFHLSLSDSDSSSAPWSLSFPTTSPRPYALFLESSGNFRIVDSSNTMLWQSFLHPLDILLPQQVMTPGMRLTSQTWSPSTLDITYSAVMEPAGLALFANFSESTSLPYSVFGLNASLVGLKDVMHDQASCTGHSALFFHDGKQLILQSCIVNVSVSRSLAMGMDDPALDFLRLESDGSIRGYKFDYGNSTWTAVYDWFANSSNGVCSVPSVCGTYGICTHSTGNRSYSECSCPSLPKKLSFEPRVFTMVNTSDTHKGCSLVHALNCTPGEESHYFIELQGVDYFANDALLSTQTANTTKQQCVAACAQNCKCKAAFYRTDAAACFLHEQVLSIIGLGNSTQLHTSVYHYEQATANTTQRLSIFKQDFVNEQAALQGQSAHVFPSLDLTKLGSADVLTDYVGYLKLQNNSVQGGGSVSKAGDRRYLIITVVGTIGGFVLLGVTFWLLCLCCKRRGRFKALRDEDLFATTFPGQHSVIHFTFAQLQAASGDFKSKLGIGGFGSVYKGSLPNGSCIAIKQLESAIRSEKDFELQVLYLNSLNHPNLVRLTGLCMSNYRRFLVSEYMQNGSLDAWLFHKTAHKSQDKECSSSSLLDWETRFKIALDVAEGLAFLHHSNLVHLNVKPQNILLDENFAAKLSDYGLSRLMDREEGSMIMHMRGSPGYMAPEWIQHACATKKSDVYSYGMVLMEMLGGRKNVDLSKERENWYFPILAAKMLKEDKLLEVLDEKLTRCKAMGEAECEQARRLMRVAFWCIVENPSKRPDMRNISSMLQGHDEVPEPPLPLHFDGHGVHNSMYDDNQHFFHGYYNQSESSPPNRFNISLVSEPLPSLSVYSSWSSSRGLLDDCTLLLPSHD